MHKDRFNLRIESLIIRSERLKQCFLINEFVSISELRVLLFVELCDQCRQIAYIQFQSQN